MDGSHIPPGSDWLEKVRTLGELIRLRRYDEPHASEVAALMAEVIKQSDQLSAAYQFEYLRILHNEVVRDALNEHHKPAVELLIVDRLLRLYPYNDDYGRYLIGRKCSLLRSMPWLGMPGEVTWLERELKRLTPPSKSKRTLYFLLEFSIRYWLARHETARK